MLHNTGPATRINRLLVSLPGKDAQFHVMWAQRSGTHDSLLASLLLVGAVQCKGSLTVLARMRNFGQMEA